MEKRQQSSAVSPWRWRASTHLVFVSGEAAALHGAGVEVALVVELEAGQARVQLVQDGRQAAAEGQQLSAGAVEADAHGALQGDAAAVAQQRADKRGSWKVRKRAEGGAASTGFNFLLYKDDYVRVIEWFIF